VLASDTLTVDEATLTVDVKPADLHTLELVNSTQSVPEIRAGAGVALATFSAHDRFGNCLGSKDISAINVALKRNDTAGDVVSRDVVSVRLEWHPDGWQLRWLPEKCGTYVLQPDATVEDRHGAGLRRLRVLGQGLTVDVRPGPLFMLQAIAPTKVEGVAGKAVELCCFAPKDAHGNHIVSAVEAPNMTVLLKHMATGEQTEVPLTTAQGMLQLKWEPKRAGDFKVMEHATHGDSRVRIQRHEEVVLTVKPGRLETLHGPIDPPHGTTAGEELRLAFIAEDVHGNRTTDIGDTVRINWMLSGNPHEQVEASSRQSSQPDGTVHLYCTLKQVGTYTASTTVWVDTTPERWRKVQLRGTGASSSGIVVTAGPVCTIEQQLPFATPCGCVSSVAGQDVTVAVFRPKDAVGNKVCTLGTHTIHVSLKHEISGEISRVPLRACGDALELVWKPEKSGQYYLEKVASMTTGVSEAERVLVDVKAQEALRVDVRPGQVASLHLLEPGVVRTRATELSRGKHLATFRRLDAFGNELESSYDLTKMELKHADTGK
jgi:hypothetical protein